MNIMDIMEKKFFFFKQLNNLEQNEITPWTMSGTETSRIFSDISTNSFINIIFNEKDILYNFIDYTYYEIYQDISEVHQLLKNNGYYLSESEYIKVIFKGGNVMSFLYEDIIKNKILNNNNIKNFNLSELLNYYKERNIEIPDDCKNFVHMDSDKNIETFLNDTSSKFKISDVDFTVYLNIKEPIRYSIFAQLYGKILMKSLNNIKNFFNNYYNNVRNEDNNEIIEIQHDTLLPFEPNDMDEDDIFEILKNYINIIKKENNIFNNKIYTPYNLTIQNNFIHFNKTFLNNFLIAAHDFENYKDNNNNSKYYEKIRNIRLIVLIKEYFELLIIYLTMYNNSKHHQLDDYDTEIIDDIISEIDNYLIITTKILLFHIKNKKRIVLDSNMYTLDKINDLLGNIKHKYNNSPELPHHSDSQELYKTKYSSSFNKKNIHTKVDLHRQNPNSDLLFTNYVKKQESDKNNEIDIVSKNNYIISCKNDVNVYNIEEINDGHNNYHYITYNNCIFTNNAYKTTSFDIYRIKFNIVGNNIFYKDGKPNKNYNLPSEFIDVSISNYLDSTRKIYYNEVQKEGCGLLKIINKNKTYYWDSYTIEQLINDLWFVLFSQKLGIPWYDTKYDKRITRTLILYCLLKITKNDKKNINWLCGLTDFLTLSCDMYSYTISNNNYPSINKFILGTDYLKKYTMEEGNFLSNYVIKNLTHDIKEIDLSNLIIVSDEYHEYDILLKFIIFYGNIMKNESFFTIFNNIRENSGITKYSFGQTINIHGTEINVLENNNNKFKNLLKTIINILPIIIYLMNETIDNCKVTDFKNCNKKINESDKKYKIVKNIQT